MTADRIQLYLVDYSTTWKTTGRVASLHVDKVRCNLPKDVDAELESVVRENATHIIGHFSDEKLAFFMRGEADQAEPTTQYILAVTTLSGRDARAWPHKKTERAHRKVTFVFFARVCSEVEKRSVMDAFLAIDRRVAEGIVTGRRLDVPRDLHALMFEEEGSDTLSALTILCQGFLAVHAVPGTKTPDGVPSGARDVVGEALSQMRWGDIDATLLPVSFASAEWREERRREVRSPQWWNPAFEGTDLRAIVEREWGDESLVKLTDVLKLVEAIEAKGDLDTRETHVSPDIVAKAYHALCSRLSHA
jgi:hypothetical protein